MSSRKDDPLKHELKGEQLSFLISTQTLLEHEINPEFIRLMEDPSRRKDGPSIEHTQRYKPGAERTLIPAEEVRMDFWINETEIESDWHISVNLRFAREEDGALDLRSVRVFFMEKTETGMQEREMRFDNYLSAGDGQITVIIPQDKIATEKRVCDVNFVQGKPVVVPIMEEDGFWNDDLAQLGLDTFRDAMDVAAYCFQKGETLFPPDDNPFAREQLSGVGSGV